MKLAKASETSEECKVTFRQHLAAVKNKHQKFCSLKQVVVCAYKHRSTGKKVLFAGVYTAVRPALDLYSPRRVTTL